MLIPRQYQIDGIEFLKKHNRAILADQPGLGKTLQAILAATTPVLVACPVYLVEQWYDALQEQFPEAKISAAYGSRTNKREALLTESDWLIINIEMMRNYDFNGFNTLIIDEAHRIRGRNSQQSKGARFLARKAKNLFLLTATPIYKTADDLWALLNAIDHKVFGSYWKFIDRYFLVTEDGWKTQIVGIKNSKMMNNMLSKYMLLRTYKEVGLQLPNLIHNNIIIKPNKSFQKVYLKVKEDWLLGDIRLQNPMEVFLILRKLTVTQQKLDVISSLIEDNPNDNVVIFCWYVETAKQISLHIGCSCITGEIPPEERVLIAKTSPRIVATMSSLSEGVDLSNARTVIFFEEDYTPGRMYQALSRIRRISENNEPIKCYTILTKNTIDETIHKAINKRVSSSREIVNMEMLNK